MGVRVNDPEVYGQPVYSDALIDPDVYGEAPLFDEAASNFGTSSLTIDAPIRALAGANLVLDAALANAIGEDLEFGYEIEAGVGAEITIDAAIRQLVSDDLVIDAQIGEEVPVVEEVGGSGVIIFGEEDWRGRRALEAKVRRTVGSDLTIDHAILSIAGTPLVLRFESRQLVGAVLGIDSRIANSLRKDLTFDHERVDMYDQNEALLLAELDPDLADLYHARERAA